jgi:hypothetical protein
MLRIFWIAVALLIAAPTSAEPRSIDDCEKIKEPEAYNLCLASFGPTRSQHNKTYPGVASEGDKAVDKTETATPTAVTESGRHARGGRSHGRHHGWGGRSRKGRTRMEFRTGR